MHHSWGWLSWGDLKFVQTDVHVQTDLLFFSINGWANFLINTSKGLTLEICFHLWSLVSTPFNFRLNRWMHHHPANADARRGKIEVNWTRLRWVPLLISAFLLLGVMRNLSGEPIVRLGCCHMPHLFLQPPLSNRTSPPNRHGKMALPLEPFESRAPESLLGQAVNMCQCCFGVREYLGPPLIAAHLTTAWKCVTKGTTDSFSWGLL